MGGGWGRVIWGGLGSDNIQPDPPPLIPKTDLKQGMRASLRCSMCTVEHGVSAAQQRVRMSVASEDMPLREEDEEGVEEDAVPAQRDAAVEGNVEAPPRGNDGPEVDGEQEKRDSFVV